MSPVPRRAAVHTFLWNEWGFRTVAHSHKRCKSQTAVQTSACQRSWLCNGTAKYEINTEQWQTYTLKWPQGCMSIRDARKKIIIFFKLNRQKYSSDILLPRTEFACEWQKAGRGCHLQTACPCSINQAYRRVQPAKWYRFWFCFSNLLSYGDPFRTSRSKPE